jgi:hypothetical protein
MSIVKLEDVREFLGRDGTDVQGGASPADFEGKLALKMAILEYFLEKTEYEGVVLIGLTEGPDGGTEILSIGDTPETIGLRLWLAQKFHEDLE